MKKNNFIFFCLLQVTPASQSEAWAQIFIDSFRLIAPQQLYCPSAASRSAWLNPLLAAQNFGDWRTSVRKKHRNTQTIEDFFGGVWTVTGKLGPAMDGAIRCLDDGQTVFRRTRAIPRFWSLDRFTVAATRFHRVFSSFHGFHQSRDDGISVC